MDSLDEDDFIYDSQDDEYDYLDDEYNYLDDELDYELEHHTNKLSNNEPLQHINYCQYCNLLSPLHSDDCYFHSIKITPLISEHISLKLLQGLIYDFKNDNTHYDQKLFSSLTFKTNELLDKFLNRDKWFYGLKITDKQYEQIKQNFNNFQCVCKKTCYSTFLNERIWSLRFIQVLNIHMKKLMEEKKENTNAHEFNISFLMNKENYQNLKLFTANNKFNVISIQKRKKKVKSLKFFDFRLTIQLFFQYDYSIVKIFYFKYPSHSPTNSWHIDDCLENKLISLPFYQKKQKFVLPQISKKSI